MNNRMIIAFLTVIIIVGVLLYELVIKAKHKTIPFNFHIENVDAVSSFFPKDIQTIQEWTEKAISQAKTDLNNIVKISADKRTFENTLLAYDRLCAFSNLPILANLLVTFEQISPDADIRAACQKHFLMLQNFFIDTIDNNKELFEALNAYAQGAALKESLSSAQNYFLQETLDEFKRKGLNLPEDRREKLKKLSKEIAELSVQFEKNIAADASNIHVDRTALQGLNDDFINNLKKDEHGNYILGIDYPTYFNVMENCSIASTRKQLFEKTSNRAYPINDEVLRNLIAKRDELAHILGFDSFAALNLSNQMAKTPEKAENFLDNLLIKANKKEAQEFAQWTKELPASVELTSDGKLNPWDGAYLKNWYKKKHYDVDPLKIQEYFATENTIKELLAIYEQFLSLRFKQVPASLWHEDVTLIAAYDQKTDELLGYIALDLFPRANKFSHACHSGIIHAVKNDHGKNWPAVSVLICNFPKATETKPSLLTLQDVNTFFHEFGHAMHSLLGRTELASQSGTNCKMDFVEMPSQMLEQWLTQKDVLKKISKHYLTSQPLPDDLIERIINVKHFDIGTHIQRQISLGKLSFALFAPGAQKDPSIIEQEIFSAIKKHIYNDINSHFYASFGHLMGYGARYYGYLWAEVFALDIFDYLKKQGLSNPETGKYYVDKILSKGGSADPYDLLKDFLGREPNDNAFFIELGL